MEQQSALTRRYGRFRFLRFGKRQKFFLIWVILWQCATLRAQINTDAVTWMGRNALGVDDYLTAIHYFNQVIEVKPYLSRPYYRAYAQVDRTAMTSLWTGGQGSYDLTLHRWTGQL